MQTLSNGVKQPETGDRGFWSDLEDDLEILNNHTHNGTDSEGISTKHIIKTTSLILSASWVAVSGQAGTFRQTMTVPSGYEVDSMLPKFYINTGGQSGYQVHPTIRKVSNTTYDLFTNDNTVGYVAVYG
jgi:hypothetical protein